VLVTGPAGQGKSRVRYEFLRRHADVPCLIARADPLRTDVLAMLALAVRQAAGVATGDAPDVRRARLAAHVGRELPQVDRKRVTEFMGELCGVPFDDQDSVQLRAARADPVLMADQLRGALVDWLRGQTRRGPMLLVLEDLHWADGATVRFVDEVLRRLDDAPLMVLALARPEVDARFPALWASRTLHRLPLAELSRRAAERLVREVLGDAGVDPGQIVDRAQGNPFFLEELLRHVAVSGHQALPPTLVAMMQTRLEELRPELRRVLRAASLFGHTFWDAGVSALVGHDVRDAFVELSRTELIGASLNRKASNKAQNFISGCWDAIAAGETNPAAAYGC
jgi:predicted ATPase